MVGADIQHSREGRQRQILVHVMLPDDFQRTLTQAAGLAGICREADAALALGGGAQGFDGLLVGVIQAGKLGSFAAYAHIGRAAQGAVRQLANLVGKNMQIFLKVRRVAQQHRHNAAAAIKHEMP